MKQTIPETVTFFKNSDGYKTTNFDVAIKRQKILDEIDGIDDQIWSTKIRAKPRLTYFEIKKEEIDKIEIATDLNKKECYHCKGSGEKSYYCYISNNYKKYICYHCTGKG